MRIGYDAKRFFHNATGLGNYSRSLIKILSDSSPDNEYLLYNPKKSKKYTLENYSANVKEINPINIFSKKLRSIWRLLFISFQIKKDVINIYHGLSGEIPILLPRKCKKVVTIHDLIFMRYPNLYSNIDIKIYTWKFKYAAKKADVIVAISEQTKQDIIHFFGINPDKIKVIYQGCNPVFKKEYTLEEKNEVIQKFKLPKNFILNVGTIEKRKNALTIIKAIKDTSIPLVIIGKKTKYYSEIEAFMFENKMNNQVSILKGITQKELAVLYQSASIFVYPSIFEGFGIPIIEALYSKTPVVSSTGSCFTEAGGNNSIYIDPENSEKLKNEIVKLWNDDSKRIEMAQKGWSYVQKFNDDKIAQDWEKIYKALFFENKI